MNKKLLKQVKEKNGIDDRITNKELILLMLNKIDKLHEKIDKHYKIVVKADTRSKINFRLLLVLIIALIIDTFIIMFKSLG